MYGCVLKSKYLIRITCSMGTLVEHEDPLAWSDGLNDEREVVQGMLLQVPSF